MLYLTQLPSSQVNLFGKQVVRVRDLATSSQKKHVHKVRAFTGNFNASFAESFKASVSQGRAEGWDARQLSQQLLAPHAHFLPTFGAIPKILSATPDFEVSKFCWMVDFSAISNLPSATPKRRNLGVALRNLGVVLKMVWYEHKKSYHRHTNLKILCMSLGFHNMNDIKNSRSRST